MKTWRQWPIKEITSNNFPRQLRDIGNYPDKLYYRGLWTEEIFDQGLAVVGSRRMTRYGRETIGKFMPEIVSRKTTVISGFMYGVDTEAHKECLNCGGKTIAVLGGGLNVLTPAENDNLYSEILENDGLIVSEYEPEFQPTLWSFPQRNRIVSALSTVGILVVEAGIKSGSLITAKIGMKQNKRVLAIPGPINSSVSEGTNWLIKSGGAKMVMTADDIFDDSCHSPDQQSLFKDYSDLSLLERQIISILETEEITIDELCRRIKSPVSEISRSVSMMLMRDLIIEEHGKIYLN